MGYKIASSQLYTVWSQLCKNHVLTGMNRPTFFKKEDEPFQKETDNITTCNFVNKLIIQNYQSVKFLW